MEYKLEDIIDISLLQELQDKLNVIYSFPSAIIDVDGKILTAVAWQDLCTKFHRVNPEAEKECIKSDKYIFEHLDEAKPAVSYQCPHGLVDNATPIIIDGKHLGNFFTGQFFIEKPDIKFFKKQAARFGFNEEEYLEAVKKVPIWSREKLNQYLSFIKGFIEIIAGMGLKNLKEIETSRKIKESEERYKSIVQSTSDWIWEIDELGNYCYCSEKIKQILGYEVEEILGKSPFDLMPLEEKERLGKIFQEIIASKSPIVDLENWNIHKDGHRVCLLTNGFPVFDQTGKLIGYKGADKDISDRKHDEEILKTSEERYRQLFEASPNGIVHIGPDGIITKANIEEARMFGYNSPLDLVGVHATQLVAPSSRDYSAQIMQRRLNGEEIPPVEYSLIRKDGTIFYGDISASILRKIDGSVSGYICLTHDTTERKKTETMLRESELQFRSTFEQNSVGMAHISLTGKWFNVNQQLCEILGYPREEILTKSFRDITHPDDLPLDEENFSRLIADEIKSYSREKRYIRKDKSEIWVSLNATAFRNVYGNIEYIIVVIKDISDRKEMELALSKSEDKFAKAFRMSPEAISISSMENWKYIDVNENFCRLSGFSREEIIGHTPIELNMLPDVVDVQRFSKEVLDLGSVKDYYRKYRKRSGEIGEALITSSVIELEGKKCSINFIHDITERKHAEEALRESEAKLSAMFECSRDAIGVSQKGIHVFVNPAYLKLFGYENNDLLLGTPIIDCIAPSFRDEMIQNIKQRTAGESVPKFYEGRCIKKDGTEFEAEFSVSTYDLGGEVYSLAYIRDITERKRSEETLRDNEIQFRALFEKANEGIIYISLNSEIVDVNESFARMHGYSIDEMKKKQLQDLDVEDLSKLNPERFKRIGDGENISFEVKHYHKDGHIIDLEVSAFMISLKSKNYLVAFHRDITERKRSEELLRNERNLLRTLIDALPESVYIYIKDSNSRYLINNLSHLRSLGVARQQDVIGKTSKDFFPPEEAESILRNEQNVIQYGQALINLEEMVYNKEFGQERWHLTTKVPLLDSAGKIVGLVGMSSDITERKNVEKELATHRNHLEELVKTRTEELDNTNEELQLQLEKQKEYEMMLQQSLAKEQELNEMKSRFISTTSHEFKTPLTSILSSAGLIQRYVDRWTPEKRNEHLDRIQKSVQNLSKLVDDVLTISKTEHGNISINPEPIDLQKHAAECLDDVKSLMAGNHKLKFEYKSKRKQFELDPKLMKFIFNNLLSNAIKYSPDGGRIELTINSDEQFLRIKVKDEGIGIPNEDTGKIFDSFYRTKNAGEIKGTGLGLAIVKRAVDLHGGEITVSSELNIGTTFTVMIPA